MIDDLLQQLRVNLQPPATNTVPRDVPHLLYHLLHKQVWDEEDFDILNEMGKRVDISGKLFAEYDVSWRKLSNKPLIQSWQNVMTLLMYKVFLQEKESRISSDALCKRLNTLLKCLKISDAAWVSEILQSIQEDLKILQAKCLEASNTELSISQSKNIRYPEIKTLPLTMLFYESPIARAYLETLYAMNLRPEKIIQLVSSVDLFSKKPVGRWLPTNLRKTYASYLQKSKIHHWPTYIRKAHPNLHQMIQNEVIAKFNFSLDTLNSAAALKPLSDYSDRIDTLLIENLNDPRLYVYLSDHAKTTLLFTGGGIVPARLLDLPHLRFIHVHPGYLPEIKGADCVLWSTLFTGYASATSFYMSPGIDTGDIIRACWLPKVNFNVDWDAYPLKTWYRAIYAFFDPWVRASVLRETLAAYEDLARIVAIPQDASMGLTFHFMHENLQKIALQNLCTPP